MAALGHAAETVIMIVHSDVLFVFASLTEAGIISVWFLSSAPSCALSTKTVNRKKKRKKKPHALLNLRKIHIILHLTLLLSFLPNNLISCSSSCFFLVRVTFSFLLPLSQDF